jgi:hypothetical protein
MAVGEEDVKREEHIQEDFRDAKEIMKRIEAELVKEHPDLVRIANPHMVFALCLIYVRQLKHHEKEDGLLK